MIDSMPEGGDLVVHWSGHGVPGGVNDPHLFANDSPNNAVAGIPLTDLVTKCAASEPTNSW
jgi:hypothetical protein